MPRLLVWYTVATALLRCPSSFEGLTDDSPRVCKPYLSARSHVAPYVQPYYDTYAAPHVERARPYVDRFNEQVYTPSVKYGRESYTKYGAPRVDQVRGYGQEKWMKILKPQMDTAQAQVKTQYDSTLAPHVGKASAAAAPYYTASRHKVVQIYGSQILPAYEACRPYAQKTYTLGHKLVIDTGLPYVRSASATTFVFLDRILWPKLRILYGENVEPQLVRIGERLGRYRDGKKLQAAMDDIDHSSQASSASSSSSITSISAASAHTTASSTNSVVATASPSLTVEEEAEQTRQKIESDLKNWQDKFAKAADKGTEDLQERVKEITDRQIDSQVRGVAEALVIQLEETSRSETARLQKTIKSIVTSLAEEPSDSDLKEAEDDLSKATRAAGLAVKDKAQALRSWKEKFDQETQSLVSAASNSTLEVIDNIRDLGLQEIGMRWAWMEGVTYKDWSKYHEVKKTFDEWRQEIEAVAKNHEGLRRSKDASEELESKGMSTAEQAAKELGRLKEVGKWKIQAKDASEDFSTKYMPAAAAAAGQKVMEKASSASEHIIGTSQGTMESIVSEATQRASDAISAASSDFIGTTQGTMESIVSEAAQRASDAVSGASAQIIGTEPGRVEKISSKISEAASIASEKASEAVVGTPQPMSQSVISAAKDKATQMASGASEAIIGTPLPIHESVASEASKSMGSAASVMSEVIAGSSTPLTDSVSSVASDASSSASSMASKASKKVYGGAMAQKVKEQKPILDDVITDDDSTYSERLQSMVSQAGDKYADVTMAVSEALMKATSTQGTVASASSVADEQYSKALSAASSVLYGSQKGAAESVTSIASDKWAEAVAA